MKVLVLCTAYPDHQRNKALNYVHIRNKYYMKEGIIPVILNFSAKSSYELDGIHVIYNSIGQIFEEMQYDPNLRKKYDFITIRSNMDSSVYCLDIVTRLAQENPERAFLVIGKGDWFECETD